MQRAQISQEEFLKHTFYTIEAEIHCPGFRNPNPLTQQPPQPTDDAEEQHKHKISAGSCAHLTGCRTWGKPHQQGLAAGIVWNSKGAQANKPGLMTCAWHFGGVSCSRGMKEACGSPVTWPCGDGRSSVYLRSIWDPTVWFVEAVWGLWGFSWFAVDTGSYILQTAVLSMVQLFAHLYSYIRDDLDQSELLKGDRR